MPLTEVQLDQLQEETGKLFALLKERQLDHPIWQGLLGRQLEQVHKLAGETLGSWSFPDQRPDEMWTITRL